MKNRNFDEEEVPQNKRRTLNVKSLASEKSVTKRWTIVNWMDFLRLPNFQGISYELLKK